MKIITNDFKEALKNIKQIDVIVSYADKENTNFIITQNSEILLTEAQDYLVTESAEVIIDNGGIQKASINWDTDIFKSTCKMLNLETINKISKNTELNIKIGLLIDDEYEYIDYGKFYTILEPKYNLDTNTYSITAYDKMIKFNIRASENPILFNENKYYTLNQYLQLICNKCGVTYNFDFTNVINANISLINKNPYENSENATYRDIIDDIAECLGTNFIIDSDNKITNKELDLTSQIIIDDDLMKDTNINIGEKKQPITGITVYDGSTMINYVGDNTSTFKIKNNNIMSLYSENLINNVLDMIAGFSYYTYNLETFGILALEPFDCFTVNYKNINYLLCSFHNDIIVSSGLNEEISYYFKNEDNVYEYMTSNEKDKQRDASIKIDKALGEVVLKANAEGKIVQVELKANPETGSEFNVSADNINFEGKEFNITTENMKITLGTGENKKELINSLGIMTTIIVQGNVISSSFTGGTMMLPMGYSQAENGYAKDRLEFDFVIPKGFVVDKAYVTLNHMPSTITYDYNYSIQGYCRNMRLYKATSYNNGRLLIDLLTYSPIGESGVSYQSISNIFNGSDFSGNNNGFSNATSSDISNYITTSDNEYSYNKFKIETADGQPSSFEDMASRNGCLQGTMTIIGHMKF